jgi:hypothetical protein
MAHILNSICGSTLDRSNSLSVLERQKEPECLKLFKVLLSLVAPFHKLGGVYTLAFSSLWYDVDVS